jgi:hypothetical protein
LHVHADSSFYLGLKTIGALFQFLHYLPIETTIQFHHQNPDESCNEPRSPVPMIIIQNKKQNLKNQNNQKISKRELKALMTLKTD